jgi:hypothetical protein
MPPTTDPGPGPPPGKQTGESAAPLKEIATGESYTAGILLPADSARQKRADAQSNHILWEATRATSEGVPSPQIAFAGLPG